MGAYEDIRDDVTARYTGIVSEQQARQMQEGLGSVVPIPAVTVSGSKPAWLGAGARIAFAWFAVVGAVVGLVLTAALADTSAGAAATTGGFAMVALVIAYLTVAGFGKVEFSVGSGGEGSAAGDTPSTDGARPRLGSNDAAR
ncbi:MULTISPECIES: hypothetical protein [unclassified Nocardioides]|uniref:hypothetical protein n=1 Tax=unclassified Nocardioides TaxID=2615069 RepID=UPI0036177D0A